MEKAVETWTGSKQIINNNHNVQHTVTGDYDIHNIIPDNNDKKTALNPKASKYSIRYKHWLCTDWIQSWFKEYALIKYRADSKNMRWLNIELIQRICAD